MRTLDWIVLILPILIVIWSALKAQKHVRGVADFLSAGRIAGRYVLCIASGEAGMGLITFVGLMEMYYNCGFAVSFWSTVSMPIAMLLALFGFCTYRFRETKAMTLGQFFELRYNRPFRLTAAVIQAFYGVLNYAIFPAVSCRCLMYFLDLPVRFSLFGVEVSTFAALMLVALGLATWVACAGGQVTIMVTDCMQGIVGYPMYLIVIAYLMWRFSWREEMMPALLQRPPQQSFLDPFDIAEMRDFNLVYVLSGIVGMVLFRLSWGGRGYDSSARNAHEAKMGALLGTWRGAFTSLVFILLAVVAFTYLNHPHFAEEANLLRRSLAGKTSEDVLGPHAFVGDTLAEARAALPAVYAEIPARTQFSETYASKEAYEAETRDPYLAATQRVLGDTPEARARMQSFRAIYLQMIVPSALREILPTGLLGMLCAMMVFMMLSTDTTYLHAWSSVIVQDIVMPLRGRAMSPRLQINLLRIGIVLVALSAFLFSFYFGQIDFVMMFFSITGAIWAASGPVITLGLYWSRGTSAGAFSALLLGAGTAVSSIFAQKFWVSDLYPAIERAGLVETFDRVLRALSAPMYPYVDWHMRADQFPMTSVEVALLVNIITILIYIVVSLLTCRKPFNMERMLHRGKYADPGEVPEKPLPWRWRTLPSKLVGITAEYSRGDKVLAWSVFLWSFVWGFVLCFLAVLVWHHFSPWGVEEWSLYFWVKNLLVCIIIGVISTIWFGYGGVRDLWRLFRDLEKGSVNVLDDGRVSGNVSVADASAVAAVEQAAAMEEAGEHAEAAKAAPGKDCNHED